MSDSSFVSPELLPAIDDERTAVGCACPKCHVYRDSDVGETASDRELEMRKQVPSTCDVEVTSSAATRLEGIHTGVYSRITAADVGKSQKDDRRRSYNSSHSSLSSHNGSETGCSSTTNAMNETILDDSKSDKATICRQEKKIRFMDYQINVLKAQVRQYRNKCMKFQRLSKAAIYRDDELWDVANNNIERGILPNDGVKSDSEDDNVRNTVRYQCNIDDDDPQFIKTRLYFHIDLDSTIIFILDHYGIFICFRNIFQI